VTLFERFGGPEVGALAAADSSTGTRTEPRSRPGSARLPSLQPDRAILT